MLQQRIVFEWPWLVTGTPLLQKGAAKRAQHVAIHYLGLVQISMIAC